MSEPCLCGDPMCKRCFPFAPSEGDLCEECEEGFLDADGNCPVCAAEEEE